MQLLISIAVWGDKFIKQMCDVCLPCVLAPGNLPAIPPSERFRFVFVTRTSDVARLKSEPMVQRLQDFIPVEILEFDPTAYASTHLALSAAHRMGLTIAASESAHFVLLDPDLIFSNNTLASARRVAMTGKAAIMTSGLRLATETARPALRKLRLAETYAENEILEPRNLMKFAMKHFHPEVARYDFGSPNFTQWPLVCLWPVGNEGVLDRSFHLHPLVLDMRNCRREAMATFDNDTIDGAFVFHAFPDRKKIYVEEDSDNMLVFSFSSLDECIEPMRENRASVELLRRTAYMFNVNPLHRSFFDRAIKMHTGDLNDAWFALEKSTAGLSRHFRYPPRQLRLVSDYLALLRDCIGLPPPPHEHWKTHYDRGIQREAEGDHLGAAEDFAHAIRIGPPNLALHYMRGVALLCANDERGAATEFKASLKLDPGNAALRDLLNAYQPAISAQLRLFKVNPPPGEHWKTYHDRGIQREAERDHLGAAEDFAHAIRIGPPNVALHYMRGVALLRANDEQGAVTEFKACLKLDPGNAALRDLLNAYQPAISAQLRLFEINPPPGEHWKTYHDRGIQRDAEGDHLGAAKDFAHAIRIGPPNVALHYMRGVALLRANDERAAATEFKAGLRLDPGNTALRDLLDTYRPTIFARLRLFKLVCIDCWQKRQRIKNRLWDCTSDKNSRVRVRRRIRQLTLLATSGRPPRDFQIDDVVPR